MGCEYYQLKAPWTSLRTSDHGIHTRLNLWVNRALTGELTLRREELTDVLLSICEQHPIAKVSSLDEGQHISIFDDPQSRQVISEHGNVEEWDLLKARYPISPCVELDDLIQWAQKYTKEVGPYAIGATFFIVEETSQALRKAEKALLETKVTPMKGAIKELRVLKERSDLDIKTATHT